MTTPSTIQEGGPVFVAILVCGLIAALIFVERLVQLHRARIRFTDFLAGIFNILSKGKIREATAICDETAGPIARIAHSAILHRADAPDTLKSVVENAGKVEIARMERRLRVLSAIMHATPLLGLLGGVLGGLRTVHAMQASLPLVQMLDLTEGLASALLCAAAGLAVSIVSFVMFNIILVRIDRIILDMEQATADILAFIPTIAAIPGDAPTVSKGKGETK